MAELAVAYIGSAVGSAVLGAGVLGVSGATIGWFAGTLIAQSLFAKSVEGPKLDDKKVQISSYGAPVPLMYGGVRVAGNVFWSTDLVEHKRTSGGKGGPKVTKYSYSVSCATMLGASEVVAIRRIWADAKCVYDARENAPVASHVASAKFQEYFTLYHGDESQLPDPTMEAKDGAGNVPAYRGIAYVVFTNLPLDDYGNRIPNFTFEVSNQAPLPLDLIDRAPLIVYPWEFDTDGRPIHGHGAPMEYFLGGGGAHGASLGNDYAAAVAASAAYRYANGGYGYAINGMDHATNYIGYSTSTNFIFEHLTNGAQVTLKLAGSQEYCEYKHSAIIPTKYSSRPYDGNVYTGDADDAGIGTDSGEYAYTTCTDRWINGSAPLFYASAVVTIMSRDAWLANTNPDLGFLNNHLGRPFVGSGYPVAVGPRIVAMYAHRVPTVPIQACFPDVDPCVDGLAQIPDNSEYCIDCDGEISYNWTYHSATGTAKQLCAIEYRDGALYQQALAPVLLPGDPDYSNTAFWDAARDAAIAKGKMAADVTYPVVVSEWGESDALTLNVVGAGFTRLYTIVSDLCVKSGLDVSQFDVTELTDFVQGYTVGRQASARQAIDQLRSAYFFDAVESGEIIKFVKRGHDPIATLTTDDLGASENGDAPLIEHQRKQETELPATLNVAYSDRELDYQTGTQIAKRLTVISDQESTMELSIVMSEKKARQVADTLLYDAYASRTSRNIALTRKWAHIEPTDVIVVPDSEGFTYTLMVLDKTEDGGVIKLQCQDQEKSAYVPPDDLDPDDPVNTVVSSNVGGTPTYPGPTKLVLLDIPLLRQTDTPIGYYAAVTGYRAAWKGGVIFRSDDAGATYVQKLEATNAATVGYATTVLASYGGGNTVDQISDVTVRMHTGTLSSCTRDQLLNNANGILLGNEILQFMTATLVSTGVYKLTGLLRGRLGTERYMGTHEVDEILILLDPEKLYRIQDVVSTLNIAELYKGVTYGDPITSASAISFTNTGASLKALAPVHLAAVNAGGGMYRVKWTRRPRYGGEWLPYVDVVQDMSEESYFVYVRRAGVGVARAFVSNATTVDIAALAGDVIEVSQISDRVSLGFTSSITVV